MAQISESLATLRFSGDSLDPKEMTRLLGCEPTAAHFLGQEIVHPVTKNKRLARFGSWRLTAKDCAPEDLDGQISELLEQLTPELTVWSDLAKQFEIDLFVGLNMQETNEGCVLSADSLRKLGERGISLGLDVYAPPDE